MTERTTDTRDDLLFALNDASDQEQIVTCMLMSPLSGMLMTIMGPIANFTSLSREMIAELGKDPSLLGRISDNDPDADIDRDIQASMFAVGDMHTHVIVPPTEAIKQIRTTDDPDNGTKHYGIDLLDDCIMGFVIDLDE